MLGGRGDGPRDVACCSGVGMQKESEFAVFDEAGDEAVVAVGPREIVRLPIGDMK